MPPYSILAWYDIDEQGWIDDALKLKLYIDKKLSNLQNAKLYDFQADMRFITNLDNYEDTTHFKAKYSSYIIEGIVEKKVSSDINKNNAKIKAYIKNLKNGFLEEFLN